MPREEMPALRFPEIRGLWVVRGSLTDPDSIRAMVRRADEAGFNTLLVQVRGRGDAYYESGWEPRSHLLVGDNAGLDPLDLVLKEAQARGLAVHAWLNTHLVASVLTPPAAPNHISNARPDLLAVPRELALDLYDRDPRSPGYREALVQHALDNREGVEGLFSSPAHPEVQEHVYSVVMDLVGRYPLDGVHLDYIRYPSSRYDYSRVALERFSSWLTPRIDPDEAARLSRESGTDPLTWVTGHPDAWDEFRRAQITSLVERVYLGVKSRRPGMVVSAAVFPDPVDAFETRFQDWPFWLQRGIVDVVAPMSYTGDPETFRTQTSWALSAASGQDWRIWSGIGAYLNSFEGTLEKAHIAREMGAVGLVVFSYDWSVTEGKAPDGGPFLPALGDRLFRRSRR
jgi:uncharacterized lipoprotein YddW (UPF0748 family)